MKLSKAINELKVPVNSNTSLAKRLRDYRGISMIILNEKEPPDVHGIPSELEAYGRGGFLDDGQIWVDGGATGSRQGHPEFIKNGFYWGADQDVRWTGSDGKIRDGVIYVRGRAGTDENVLKERIKEILELVWKKIPRP